MKRVMLLFLMYVIVFAGAALADTVTIIENDGALLGTFNIVSFTSDTSDSSHKILVISDIVNPPPPVNVDLPGTYNLGTNGFRDYVRINPLSYHYYKIVVPSSAAGKMLTVTLGSRDYTTKQLLMIKKGFPQLSISEYNQIAGCFFNGGTTCSPGFILSNQYLCNGPTYWFKLDKGITYASYTIYLKNLVPDTYYLIVVNRSNATGAYRIFDSLTQ